MSGKKCDIIKMEKMKRDFEHLVNRLAGRGHVRLPLPKKCPAFLTGGHGGADKVCTFCPLSDGLKTYYGNTVKPFQDRKIVRTAFLKLSLTGMRRRNGRVEDYAVQPPG